MALRPLSMLLAALPCGAAACVVGVDLDGRACDEEHACVDGYACANGACVRDAGPEPNVDGGAPDGDGGIVGDAGDGPGDAGDGGDAGADGGLVGGDAGVVPVVLPAAIAVCAEPGAQDPVAACAAGADVEFDEMRVDLAGQDPQTNAYLYFDAGAVAGALVSVELVLHTSPDVNSGSDDTAEVHRVAPFTLATLSNAVPAPERLLAVAHGAAVANASEVRWSLPVDDVLLPDVYLEVIAVRSNALFFDNNAGLNPPRLEVRHRP